MLLRLLVLLSLIPATALGQQADEGTLLFQEEDVSVHDHGDELRVRMGEWTTVVHHHPGDLEVERVMLDAETPALYLWTEDARYPLLVLGESRIEMMYASSWSIDHLRGPRFTFPGDGTARVEDVVQRPCHPSRADLRRTRRAQLSRESLREIERSVESWTQRRRREVILRRVERNLVHDVPHFRFRGRWGRCEAGDASSTQPAQAAVTPFADGEPVLSDGELGVHIHQEMSDAGTLRVRWRGMEAFVAASPRTWPTAQVIAREVTLSRGVRALFVAGQWHAGEDYSEYENFLWILEGDTMRRVIDSETTHFFQQYNQSARFASDGTVRITRHASRECRPTRASMRRWQQRTDTDGSVEEAALTADNWVQRRSVERILQVEDGRFVHSSPRWRGSSPWGACEGLQYSACPFVDVVRADGGTSRIGEILRSIEYAPITQSLALPPSEETLVLRISEEKAETTFLDAIHVQVDGVEVLPDTCLGAAPPAYCRADGEYFVLEEGEEVELRFSFAAPTESPEVIATGFYEPDLSAPPSERH